MKVLFPGVLGLKLPVPGMGGRPAELLMWNADMNEPAGAADVLDADGGAVVPVPAGGVRVCPLLSGLTLDVLA